MRIVVKFLIASEDGIRCCSGDCWGSVVVAACWVPILDSFLLLSLSFATAAAIIGQASAAARDVGMTHSGFPRALTTIHSEQVSLDAQGSHTIRFVLVAEQRKEVLFLEVKRRGDLGARL